MKRLLVFLMVCLPLYAKKKVETRLGSFMNYHGRSLAAFQDQLSGNPVIIGAMGCTFVTKNICLGANGGAAVAAGATEQTDFQFGYGAIYGEYRLIEFFNLRLDVGGGGHRLNLTRVESDTEILQEKISNGGFLFIRPSFGFQYQPVKFFTASANVGYFLTTRSVLNSFTFGMSAMFLI